MKTLGTVPMRRSRRKLLWVGALALVAALGGAGLFASRRPAPPPPAPAPVPVTIATATAGDVPIRLAALGTVQASNTVAIHSQIDGTLKAVDFRQGQEVAEGATLATIDPRTLQAALAQAIAKNGQDQAQLIAAQKDLDRAKTLALRSFETQQNVDQQQAKTDQFKATVDADQAAIEAAQTQLSYATITAPFAGRVGIRQVDAGNVIHANDVNPITVLTQIRPSFVTFTLPQKDLADVRDAMLAGPVPVTAFDQDDVRELSQGELLLVDNQIDQTTSTIRLRATFANADERLWPGEFVHVHVQIGTRRNVVTVPQVALQRGPEGFYAWVIKPDNTAEQRPVEATPVDSGLAVVDKGVSAGERVVDNGQYRLQPGARVAAKTENAAASTGQAS